MNVLVVGNVLKDVYLNLDTRTEKLETDKNQVKWLDISFNASEHHFFNRSSSLGGAAVSLEVLQKMGINATISNFDLDFEADDRNDLMVKDYRYILISDDNVSYFVSSKHQNAKFTPPEEPADFLFIDRSANLNSTTVDKIISYLDSEKSTKLVLYVKNLENPNLNRLIPRAILVFLEKNRDNAEKSSALSSVDLDDKKVIYISDQQFSYQNITKNVSYDRVDILTHLSAYSIASATILGGLVLGKSTKDSMELAKVNLENAKINSVLSLEEMEKIIKDSPMGDDLELIAANLVLKGKGILAADESEKSIQKKFFRLQIPDTYENRRDYRNILFTTPDLEKYINGVILFDETTRQTADDGQNFVDFLTSRRIIPGIKVDKGLKNFSHSTETYTDGLNGLDERLKEYYLMGLRFAKWRASFGIHLSPSGGIVTPSENAINENCRILAEYAKKCQLNGLVPIVEPEVVYDGYYSIYDNAKVTGRILDTLFKELSDTKVNLRACILKVNMVLAGKNYRVMSSPKEVGEKTAMVLKEHVPEELAGVAFLSGGQTAKQATDNLAAIYKNGPFPWPVTFSFARALQNPALISWNGNNQNADKAKKAFLERLIANTDAIK